MESAKSLRRMLAGDDLLVAPGVFDGLSARLVEQAGFPLVYGSGGALARAGGLPDLGLLSLTEVIAGMSRIVESTTVPVIADADTGYGGVLNVARTVREFARIGVGAIHLEDQSFPKRCGHLDGKSLVSPAEMVDKITVAKDAADDSGLVIIARTDAIAVEGFAAAIDRALRYEQAGADMIFVEAPESIEQIEAIATRISAPKLINVFSGGKTPVLPLERLAGLGYRVVIIPSDLQRASIMAMRRTLEAISREGNSTSVDSSLVSFAERDEVVATKALLDMDARFRH